MPCQRGRASDAKFGKGLYNNINNPIAPIKSISSVFPAVDKLKHLFTTIPYHDEAEHSPWWLTKVIAREMLSYVWLPRVSFIHVIEAKYLLVHYYGLRSLFDCTALV